MNCQHCGAPRAPTKEGDWDHCSHDLIRAAPELLAALRLATSLLSRASAAGALYGMHDLEWAAMQSRVVGIISKVEGRDK